MSLRYTVEENPPFKFLLFYSSQHIVTMLGATIAVPILVASQFDLDAAATGLLISNVLLCMGTATFIQSTLGTRLPIVQGSSFAFLPPMLLVGTQFQSNGDPEIALRVISGAIILGSIFQIGLGFLGVAGKIQKILTPVVVGPVIIAIGLSLFGSAADLAGKHWGFASLTIILVFVFSYLKLKGASGSITSILNSIPVLSSVTIVYAICLVLTLIGEIEEDHAAYVDLSNSSLTWFRASNPFFSWGFPIYSLQSFITILFAYIVITFESIGDYNAIAETSEFVDPDLTADDKMSQHNKVSEKRVNKGIIAEGVANLFSGIIGAVPTTSYAENIGLVGLTRIASRRVVAFAGVLLIISGLIPPIAGVLRSLPDPLIGGLYCVLLGTITGIGIQITAKADTSNFRDMSIIGITVFLSFVIPDFSQNVEVQGDSGLRDVFIGIAKSHMAVAAIVGFMLDNLIPRKVEPDRSGIHG